MKGHAVEMDLIQFLRAIKDDFNKLGPECWVHEYLHKEAKAAFEEDHTVFRSEDFLKNLENSDVNKYMMKCVTELYDDKVSDMLRREKAMSNSLGDCHQNIRVLSEKKAVSERGIAIQKDFITPLADESTTSECCGYETFQEDIVSNEDFCTLSCPSSECPNEPPECSEEFTSCSSELPGCTKDARMCLHDTDLARSMPCDQRCSPTHFAPECSMETSQATVGGASPEECEGEPTGSHLAPECKPSKDQVSLQSKIDETKETTRQKRLRKKKEKQEIKELWEMMRQKRLDAGEGEYTPKKPVEKPKYHDKVQAGPSRWAGAGDKPESLSSHTTDLRAALAAMINDIESLRSSPNTQATHYVPPPLLEPLDDIRAQEPADPKPCPHWATHLHGQEMWQKCSPCRRFVTQILQLASVS
jgi:hypothetical protein